VLANIGTDELEVMSNILKPRGKVKGTGAQYIGKRV